MSKLPQEKWESFERTVIPKSAGQVQRIETRRGFYAGAASMFHLLVTGMTEGSEPQDADMEMMDGLQAELREFYAQLGRGEV